MSANAGRYNLPIVEIYRDLPDLQRLHHPERHGVQLRLMEDAHASAQRQCEEYRDVSPDDEDGACPLRARMTPGKVGFACLNALCPAKSGEHVNFPEIAAETVVYELSEIVESRRAS